MPFEQFNANDVSGKPLYILVCDCIENDDQNAYNVTKEQCSVMFFPMGQFKCGRFFYSSRV